MKARKSMMGFMKRNSQEVFRVNSSLVGNGCGVTWRNETVVPCELFTSLDSEKCSALHHHHATVFIKIKKNKKQ